MTTSSAEFSELMLMIIHLQIIPRRARALLLSVAGVLCLCFITHEAAGQRSRAGSARAIASDTLLQIVRAEDERRFETNDLGALLNDRDARVRERAALAAGRIGDERAVAPLVKLLEADADESVRASAAFAIGEIESGQGADALLAALSRKADGTDAQSVKVRARAIEALGKIAAALPKAEEARARSIGETLVATLNAEARRRPVPDRDIILLGLTAVLRVRPANVGPAVAQFLGFFDSRIRADAANTLARLRLKDGVDALRRLLVSDMDAVVRANAARALGAAEDKAAFEALLDRSVKDTDERVRVSSIRALAALKDTRATGPLLKRGSTLLGAYRAAQGTNTSARPVQLNELLEIATALGRIQANTSDQVTLDFLRAFRAAVQWTAPEAEIAFARAAPASYLREKPFDNLLFRPGASNLPWQSASAIAQALGDLATLPAADRSAAANAQADAQKALRALLNDPTTPVLAVPDVITALATHKPNDLAAVLRAQLKAPDVIVRATAAMQFAELPPVTETSRALAEALPVAMRDEQLNDAALAILDALAKQKTPPALDAIKTALDSTDYLIRRRAAALLHAADPANDGKALRVETVATRNRPADYTRALARMGKQVLAVVNTDKGAFTIELLPEAAPLNVDNFVQLARRGFFNNITFHRIVPNCVIQGGDPRGDGNGGPCYQMRFEINEVPYARGAVGIALPGKDTGGSQWFVTHAPQPHLDGGYTVFGHVIKGMEIVDAIARGDRIRSITITETARR
ncbi:hypothetical protein BH18ACI2_BH18ACI2_17640 [soil metagenome]